MSFSICEWDWSEWNICSFSRRKDQKVALVSWFTGWDNGYIVWWWPYSVRMDGSCLRLSFCPFLAPSHSQRVSSSFTISLSHSHIYTHRSLDDDVMHLYPLRWVRSLYNVHSLMVSQALLRDRKVRVRETIADSLLLCCSSFLTKWMLQVERKPKFYQSFNCAFSLSICLTIGSYCILFSLSSSCRPFDPKL